MILPFFRRGAAGQCSWPAGKGPWQLAHRAFSVQLAPEGPACWSSRVLQLLQRVYLVQLLGLQDPYPPGSVLEIAAFLSIAFESSLALKSLKAFTGARNEIIQVFLQVWGFTPWREGRQ